VGLAVNAVIEFITHSWVFVVEKSIGPITNGVNARLWLLDIFPIVAFYIERIITFFLIRVAILKQKTVRTQFSFWHIVDALIVKIALFWIWEKSI